MKIQVPVPQFVAHTVLDYDFQASKRAKGVGKLALMAGISYVLFPVALAVATIADFAFDVAHAAKEGITQAYTFSRGFYQHTSHPTIRSIFSEIID